MNSAETLKVFAGSANPKLTRAICDKLHVQPAPCETIRFGEGNTFVRVLDNILMRAMDGLEQRKEEMRDMRSIHWLTDFLDDARYAIRSLRRSSGLTAFVVLTLATGIGMTTTPFSMMDALIFRPYPVPHPGRVVALVSTTHDNSLDSFSYREYLDILNRTKSYDGVVANSAEAPVGFSADPAATPRVRGGMMVSGNFFRVLGVEPQLGRGFREDEDQVPGRDAVMVLGPDFWKQEFASDPSVVGRHVRLNGKEFTVIGVAPESFPGMQIFIRPDFYMPLAMAGVDQHSGWRRDPVGRLAATTAYLTTVTFGDRAAARHAAARVRRIHDHVRGTDAVTGRPYAGGDPALLLWVHGALVDSVLAAGNLVGTTLPAADSNRYVAEMVTAAELTGVPRRLVPSNVPELDLYIASVQPGLRCTPAAAESMAYLLDPPDLDEDIAEIWQDIRDAAIAVLPRWARQMYGYDAPPPMTPGRRTEIRQSLGVLDAMFLGQPDVLEARQRITLRMRKARRA